MPGFSPSRVADLLAADPYARSLGVELVSVTDDEIVVGLTVLPHHVNFLGVGHGGLVFSLADCAFSLASNNAGDRAVAIDTHLVLTAAAKPGDCAPGIGRRDLEGPDPRHLSGRCQS